METWRHWTILLACATTVLLPMPAAASAKPGYVVTPGDHRVELDLKGSHGYGIGIVGRRRGFELSASKGAMTVVYLLRHNHSRGDRLEARLPGVGRVSLRFQPLGPAHREPGFFPQCSGGETVKQPGYFRGTIRFRGERGYTAVQATRPRGQIVTTAREVCKRSIFDHAKRTPEGHRTQLFAYSRSRGRVVWFSAGILRDPLSTATFFSGSATERRAGMVVFREAVVLGAEGEFVTGDASDLPPTATVTPPAPFRGSAAFQRMPEGENAWSGPLSVDLPGAGRVALAGPDFSASLCRDSGCRAAGRENMRADLHDRRPPA
jgi:hypothetical protein